jgi:hypothetical protein
MSTENQDDLQKAIDQHTLSKLPPEMRRAWSDILAETEQIKSQNGNIQDHPDLLDRMDEIMLKDEFLSANTEATNEIVARAADLDLQWWIDTAPKPGDGTL